MKEDNSLISDLDRIFSAEQIRRADTLLIVPPFTRLTCASLGVHILQACAKAAGHHVAILYANLLFAKFIGEDRYNAITFNTDAQMVAERVFANAAWGGPLLGKDADDTLGDYCKTVRLEDQSDYLLTYDTLAEAAGQANVFATQLGQFIASTHFRCVGCTTMSLPTASVALLNQIKAANDDIVTIIGGANCVDAMTKGTASLSDQIDYVFSGECESVFVDFLQQLADGERPQSRIIHGTRCDDLDSIPTTDYSAYYSQASDIQVKIDWDIVHIPYESSRGCWWGQKHHCTFCGVHEMRYRMKSADRVIEQLKDMLHRHPSASVNFTDEIMPLQYFKTLLPRLKTELPNIQLFINQKASLSLPQVKQLVAAGVYNILPGIETLSTPLLTAMDKGTKVKQNIQLMRYAKACGLYLSWYFLYGIPGEKTEYYQEFLTLLPLLSHLKPPIAFQAVELMRFGLYFADADNQPVANIKPLPVYSHILPDGADIDNIAYYYTADYAAVHTDAPDLWQRIDELVSRWQQSWQQNTPPLLDITQVGDNRYLLTDTRAINQAQKFQFISEMQAATALLGQPLDRLPTGWPAEWAINQKVAIIQDGWIVPLATASADIIENLECLYRKNTVDPRIEVTTI